MPGVSGGNGGEEAEFGRRGGWSEHHRDPRVSLHPLVESLVETRARGEAKPFGAQRSRGRIPDQFPRSKLDNSTLWAPKGLASPLPDQAPTSGCKDTPGPGAGKFRCPGPPGGGSPPKTLIMFFYKRNLIPRSTIVRRCIFCASFILAITF